MVVKKHTQCPKCRKFVNFYIEERKSFKGLVVKCECGTAQKCIDSNKFISRWRIVKEEEI